MIRPVFAISERMRAQITGLRQAGRNAQDGVNMLRVAEGALGEVHSMLNRLKDMLTHAGNATLSQSQRDNLQGEINQILNEIERTAGATQFAQTPLLDGSESQRGTVLQIGASPEDYDKMQLQLPNLSSVHYLLKNISVATVESADAALGTLDKAIEMVSAQRGELGVQMNRLEHTTKSLDETADNLQDAESRIRDADMAKEMMAFAREQVLGQVAQVMMAHAIEEPQRVLQLLKSGGGGETG